MWNAGNWPENVWLAAIGLHLHFMQTFIQQHAVAVLFKQIDHRGAIQGQ